MGLWVRMQGLGCRIEGQGFMMSGKELGGGKVEELPVVLKKNLKYVAGELCDQEVLSQG